MQLGVGLGLPYTLGKPAAAFSPLDLSPVLWLDAADTSTITEVGGAVSQWDDKSGNGNHVTQGTAALQPTSGTRTINGLNVIDFASDEMSASVVVAQPFSMWLVVETDVTPARDGIAGDANAYIVHYDNSWIILSAGVNLISPSGSISANTPLMIGGVFNGLSSSLRKDGAVLATGNASTSGLSTFNVGNPSVGGFDGTIGEAILISGIPSAGEIADTETYLADKWGITL